MKISNIILAICFAILSSTARAQEKFMVVLQKDGTETKFSVEGVDKVYFLEEKNDDPEDPNEQKGTGTVGNAIDLGLSVKWADHNLGASSPEGYGGYYAWGETTEKETYNWDTSLWGRMEETELYEKGVIDANGNLTSAYDAASVNWGGTWRMATIDETKELIEKCVWEWEIYNDVRCLKATGPNGNSIYLPAAASYDANGYISDEEGDCVDIWTSSVYGNLAYFFGSTYSEYYDRGDFGYSDCGRAWGLSVRPVTP